MKEQPEQDPAIFATSLETLAVKAFGDMGQTARLCLIRDRFIAGHSNCDLRQHLDSVSPETPIRDVVDRCRVWESHADPAVHRIGKTNPDPTYPTYAVGDADSDNEATRVAVVTEQRSGQNKLEDLLRWVISTAECPAPKTEVLDVEKLLQQLVREPHSRPPAVVSPPVPRYWNRCYALSSMDSANDSGHLRDSDNPNETGPTWYVSPVGSQVIR